MISVIIPAYNRADLIGATLESLLRQTLPAHEILVVDDGSTDGTAEVAESYGGAIRVIRQENAGPAAARNRGFRESSGEFIHFFDSDDLALPNKHEVQLAALQSSGADIAYGPWVKGAITAKDFTPENQVLQQNGLPKGDLVEALLSHWSVVPHACLFRRDIVEKVGGFPESLFVAEDQLMFLRCLLAGAKVVHSPNTLELYRSDNAGKITAGDSQSKIRHFREWARFLCMAHRECLEKGRDPVRWFGFRLRCHQAALDLRNSPEADEGLISNLEKIAMSGSSGTYRFAGLLLRWHAGLKQRLTGDRSRSSFRVGRLTADQESGIALLGLSRSGTQARR